MENKRAVVIAAVIALAVAATIVGIIILITSLLRGRVSTSLSVSPSPAVIRTSSDSVLPATGEIVPAPSSNMKIVGISGYTMSYPNQWGLLRCSNSQSIEFDPSNSTDQLNIVCDYAVKPITILVSSSLNCPGEAINLGGNRVIRSKTQNADGVNYRWCVTGTGGTNLDISHRVSSTGARAASKDDSSALIEQMITTIRTGGAS